MWSDRNNMLQEYPSSSEDQPIALLCISQSTERFRGSKVRNILYEYQQLLGNNIAIRPDLLPSSIATGLLFRERIYPQVTDSNVHPNDVQNRMTGFFIWRIWKIRSSCGKNWAGNKPWYFFFTSDRLKTFITFISLSKPIASDVNEIVAVLY
jgi:hypothetical protein